MDPSISLPKKLNWNKVILTIIIILVGVAVAIAGVYCYLEKNRSADPSTVINTSNKQATSSASPSTNDVTSGWKTHTDDKNKFSIKYPANFKFEDDDEDDSELDEVVNINSSDYKLFVPQTGLRHIENGFTVLITVEVDEKITLESWLSTFKKIKQDVSSSSWRSDQETTLGGKKAYRVEYTASHGEKQTLIAAVENGKVYALRYEGEKSLDWTNSDRVSDVKIFDQMISTFKFLD